MYEELVFQLSWKSELAGLLNIDQVSNLIVYVSTSDLTL